MIKGVEVRPVTNLTDNSVRSVGREFAYTFGKIAEISEILNTMLNRDEIRTLFLATDSRPARIRRLSGFTPSGNQAIPFDTADFDAGGYFDITNPTGIAFAFGGVFRVRAFVDWSGAAGLIQLKLNATDVIAEGTQSVETMYFFKAGDFLEVLTDAAVGSGLHSPVLEIEFIRPSPHPPEVQ